MSNARRKIEDLSLIDDFMFTEASVDPVASQILVGMIIRRSTGMKVGKLVIESQKTMNGMDTDRHGIRLDVAVDEVETEEGKTIQLFDIEANNMQDDNLPRRSRYYQALTDVKVLETGVGYDKMPNLWMIWILPYDPFGMNYMMYSVKNRVEEFPEIEYNDGVRKLFLYTGGTKGGTESLKNLLVYIQSSKKENAVDEELKELHSNVERLKGRKEIGVKYMRMQDVMDYEIKKGIKEGIAEAVEAAKEEFAQKVTEEVTQKVTEEVTQKVTEEVTQKVTEEVTQKVTEEVTQKVTENVEQRMAKLTGLLLKENRIEDLARMTTDEAYRSRLIKEMGMI